MSYWRNKVALVAGGTSGLGLAIARQLACRGAQTAIAGIDDQLLRSAAQQLGETAAETMAIGADLTRQEDVDAMMAQLIGRYGRLDALFHCVGRSARGAVLATSAEDFLELLQLNFLTAVRTVRSAAPQLLASQGHVTIIGSLAAKSASRYLGAYPASKYPLAAYCQQLRLELGPQGLHTLLVCPGPIARADAGRRYDQQAAGLPDSARRPGGGVKVKGLQADKLVRAILHYCERRRPELVMPARARLLFAVSQLSPSLGDWIIGKMSS